VSHLGVLTTRDLIGNKPGPTGRRKNKDKAKSTGGGRRLNEGITSSRLFAVDRERSEENPVVQRGLAAGTQKFARSDKKCREGIIAIIRRTMNKIRKERRRTNALTTRT
jgi:hypothetical protein